MKLSLLHAVLLLAAGGASGFINTLAGGGSFLTLSVLDLIGLPLGVANASNRVGILLGAISGVLGFRSKGASDIKNSLHFAIPALIGSFLGAFLIVDLPEQLFQRLLGVAMLVMLAVLIVNPQKWLQGREIQMTPRRRAIGYVVFFLIGIYGGALQAGVGLFMIAALVLTAGLDLVKANMHKAFITMSFTILALITFALRGQVNWLYGSVLAVGYVVGSWLSARLAVERGQKFVRIVLGTVLVVLAARYLGLLKF
ncbi:MAG: sulfite exporter TauE/SafE family protein [Anaerolineae bacterium]|jgi:uncharacterized membrane protein YfcA|nr:sulfite exporter TauE/SafE family protein [Chloroflexota bacterium]